MKKIFLLACVVLGLFIQKAKAEDNVFIACDNGLEMFRWDLEFIQRASHSIEIAACFCGGTIFRELAAVLEKRLEECPQLQVYFLTTPILFEPEDKEIMSRLEKKFADRFHVQHSATVLVVWPDVAGTDNHVKMLIVDETYFSCGGTNLDQSLCSDGKFTPKRNENKGPPMGPSLPAGARDQDIVGRGPLAKELRVTFYKLYALWEHFNKTQNLEKNPESFANKTRYFSLEGKEKPYVESFEDSIAAISVAEGKAKFILSGPYQSVNPITQEYIRLIKEAKEEIIIGNLYFYPAESLFAALQEAAKRGVKITLVTNGTGGGAPDFTKYFAWANRIDYVPIFYGRTFHLWEALSCSNAKVKNTKIYEYNVNDVIYHKKVMIVDGKHLIIGSYNLGTRSDISDYEMVVTMESRLLANEAKKVISRDINLSTEITPKEARGWYFDPFTAYMGEVQKRFSGLL